jgi:hypothetical protein
MLPFVTRFAPSRHYSVDEWGRHLMSWLHKFYGLSFLPERTSE